MTTKLIKGGTVFVNGQLVKTDVRIADDKIQAIGNDLPAADETIDATNKLVAPGLVDVHVHFREPGQTYKETIEAGSKAAAHGGFTTVGAMPNVDPVPDTPARMQAQTSLNQKEGSSIFFNMVQSRMDGPVRNWLTFMASSRQALMPSATMAAVSRRLAPCIKPWKASPKKR